MGKICAWLAIAAIVTGGCTNKAESGAGGSGGASAGGSGGSGQAGDCPQIGESVCLCEPFDYAGPPQTDTGSLEVDVAFTVGTEVDDGATILALPSGEVLVLAYEPPDSWVLERFSSQGVSLWRTELPMGNANVASTPSGGIFLVAEHVGGELTIDDTTFTDDDNGATFVVQADATSGTLGGVVKLPAADGELWSGFEVDESGFYVFRTSGETSHVYRYGFDGSEIWRKDHELGSYAATLNPQGGVALAGGAADAILVRLLDTNRDDTWQLPLTETVDYFGGESIDITPTGRVAAGIRISRQDEYGEDQREYRVASFGPSGAVDLDLPQPSEPVGVVFLSETELAIWRAASDSEDAGWYLTGVGLDGNATWHWSLAARDDYQPLGRAGQLDCRDGYLFASGPYVGGLLLGEAMEVSSVGCTDHFVARFPTP